MKEFLIYFQFSIPSMLILPASSDSIKQAAAIIRSGGTVAHATETCYGLACDLRNLDAVKKLFAIKQRPLHQPVSGLFSSVDEAKKWVIWNDRAGELGKQYLPGPLTLILPIRSDAPSKLFPIPESVILSVVEGQKQTLGVRISSHPLAMSLAIACGFPISTTSANIHGQPNPYSVKDLLMQFGDKADQPDLILDSGILPQNPPSTVIDCTKGELQTARKGDIAI